MEVYLSCEQFKFALSAKDIQNDHWQRNQLA